jgi:hypothetical protein
MMGEGIRETSGSSHFEQHQESLYGLIHLDAGILEKR